LGRLPDETGVLLAQLREHLLFDPTGFSHYVMLYKQLIMVHFFATFVHCISQTIAETIELYATPQPVIFSRGKWYIYFYATFSLITLNHPVHT
jgi:hypothetical protein